LGKRGEASELDMRNISDIRYNRDKSRYVQHILQHKHKYRPIDETMDIIKMADKRKLFDTLERYRIYKTAKKKYPNKTKK
jgi:hypothetical protein